MESSNLYQHSLLAYQARSGQVHHNNNTREGRHPSSWRMPNADEVFNAPEYGVGDEVPQTNGDELDNLPNPQARYAFIDDEDDYFDHLHDPILDTDDFEVPLGPGPGPEINGGDYVDEAGDAFHDSLRPVPSPGFGYLQDRIHGSYDRGSKYTLGQRAANRNQQTGFTPFTGHASHHPNEVAQAFPAPEYNRGASDPRYAQPRRPVMRPSGPSGKVRGFPYPQAAATSGARQSPMAAPQHNEGNFAGQATGHRLPDLQNVVNPRMGGAGQATGRRLPGLQNVVNPRMGEAGQATGHRLPGLQNVVNPRMGGAGQATGRRLPGLQHVFNPPMAEASLAFPSSNQGYRHNKSPLPQQIASETHTSPYQYPIHGHDAILPQGIPLGRPNLTPSGAIRADTMATSGDASSGKYNASGQWEPLPARSLPARRQSGYQSQHSRYEPYAQRRGHATLGAPRLPEPGYRHPTHSAYNGAPQANPRSTPSGFCGQPQPHPHNLASRAMGQPGAYPNHQPGALRQFGHYPHYQTSGAVGQPLSHAHGQASRTAEQSLGHSRNQELRALQEPQIQDYPDPYGIFTENRQGPGHAAVQQSESADDVGYPLSPFFPFLCPDELLEHTQPSQAGAALQQLEPFGGAEEDHDSGNTELVTADDGGHQQELSEGNLAHLASHHEGTAWNMEGNNDIASQNSSASGTLVFRVPSPTAEEDSALVEEIRST